MFRRRREPEPELPQDEESVEEAAAEPEPEPEPEPQHAPLVPTSGPWDEADAPADELARLDLGALRVPTPPGVEVRLDVDPASQQAVAVTLVAGASQIQIGVFAAPKSSGIWDEVRREIAASLRQGGGGATEAAGRFGPELAARAVGQVPGQPNQAQQLRFVGVDGPRWFLRGLLSGPAATDRGAARVLEDAFAGVVVVRGGDARAPREPLPLVLPREVREAMGMEPAAEGRPVIDVFTRGPEITETR